jgi:hypothetical protein
MNTYENRYFHIRLDFPDTWKLTSWRHTKIARSSQSAYQARDDDLPKKRKCASKFLFTAALHPAQSEALVDADVELSVYLLSPGEDMRTTLVENFERECAYYESNGIATSITREGVWTLGSLDFTYVDQESKTRAGRSQYRFFFRPLHEAFWLYGKIAGHKQKAYKDALKIVEGLKSTAGSIG